MQKSRTKSWLAPVKEILSQDDFRLADIAHKYGTNPQAFYVGSDFSGCDLRGEDLRGFDFAGCCFTDALLEGTLLTDDQIETYLGLRKAADWSQFLGGIKRQSERLPISDLITPFIPDLRRYSRALLGEAQIGDSIIVEMLEALIERPALFVPRSDPRLALYSTFHKFLNTSSVDVYKLVKGDDIGGRIMDVPYDLRSAFLLTNVALFADSDAATILSVGINEFESLLEGSNSYILGMLSTKALIVEDEPLAAMDLREMCEELGHNVVGEARTRSEANMMVELNGPDLLLIDIQLADGSSGLDFAFDATIERDVVIILVTAFPERILKGPRPEPAFLISKPFRVEMLKAIVSQALFFKRFARRQYSNRS